MNTFLGIPYFICAVICIGIATLYFFVTPKRDPTLLKTWEKFILRYFHSIVWIIFAVNCLVANAGWQNGMIDILLWLSLAFYIVFMATFLITKGRR